MNYYIKDENDKIILFDTNKEQLVNTLAFMPEYSEDDILETSKKIIEKDGSFYFEDDEALVSIRQKEFYNTFLATSKGNYRLQPKGYANAQQSVDTINGMVNALNGLTQQIAQMVIFYPTPDFTKEEECTEAWLIAHQYNAEPMTKEEWIDFYIEFSSLYAKNQYKKANENVN